MPQEFGLEALLMPYRKKVNPKNKRRYGAQLNHSFSTILHCMRTITSCLRASANLALWQFKSKTDSMQSKAKRGATPAATC